MAYGIRALARVLITHQDKYNIRTIKEVAQRYANHGKRHGRIIAWLFPKLQNSRK